MKQSSEVVWVLLALAVASSNAGAQHTRTDATAVVMNGSDMAAMAAHMVMTPSRSATAADSTRANEVVNDLRSAISKYRRPNRRSRRIPDVRSTAQEPARLSLHKESLGAGESVHFQCGAPDITTI